MIYERVLDYFKLRRQKILDGGINCIPLPFTRFREELPGIEQDRYYVITGGTKSSKTQLTTFLAIINTVLFIKANPEVIRAKIFYFPLEETKENVTIRVMAFFLNFLSKGEFHISPTDLTSTDERKPLSEEAIKAMESPEFKELMALYESIIEFREIYNPTGMYKILKGYAETHGKTIYRDKEWDIVDDNGVTRHIVGKEFDHYEADDPDEYVMVITDHLGCLHEERDTPTLKQTIEKWSEYCMQLRNRYKYIFFNIQQQNMETTNLEAFKNNKIRPTKDGLKDSKKPGEDCNCLIGITNPYVFEIKEYLGYDISVLKDCARFMEVVLNRNGRANGICPLYFDGAVDLYKELPLPNELIPGTPTPKISVIYTKIKQKNKIFLAFSSKKSLMGLHIRKHLRTFAAHFRSIFNL